MGDKSFYTSVHCSSIGMTAGAGREIELEMMMCDEYIRLDNTILYREIFFAVENKGAYFTTNPKTYSNDNARYIIIFR